MNSSGQNNNATLNVFQKYIMTSGTGIKKKYKMNLIIFNILIDGVEGV